MPKNKQYLSVQLLKLMGHNITNKEFEVAAAKYLEHEYTIYDIKDIITINKKTKNKK